MKKQYIVRAADADFVVKETFTNIDEAFAYADKMGTIFGSWNVEVYKI